jgi:hypothetical protein
MLEETVEQKLKLVAITGADQETKTDKLFNRDRSDKL